MTALPLPGPHRQGGSCGGGQTISRVLDLSFWAPQGPPKKKGPQAPIKLGDLSFLGGLGPLRKPYTAPRPPKKERSGMGWASPLSTPRPPKKERSGERSGDHGWDLSFLGGLGAGKGSVRPCGCEEALCHMHIWICGCEEALCNWGVDLSFFGAPWGGRTFLF